MWPTYNMQAGAAAVLLPPPTTGAVAAISCLGLSPCGTTVVAGLSNGAVAACRLPKANQPAWS